MSRMHSESTHWVDKNSRDAPFLGIRHAVCCGPFLQGIVLGSLGTLGGFLYPPLVNKNSFSAPGD